MKENKMPTARILLFFSVAIAVLGLIISGYIAVINFPGIKGMIIAAAVLFISLFLAIAVRMFSIIGQIIFDLKELIPGGLRNDERELKIINQHLNQLQSTYDEQLNKLQSIYDDLENFKSSLEHIGCDSRDINQNIHDIKYFFEQIEKHLDLKK
jgi:5-bromo-4-chloroindolyl phosphate hydrolysis protein